MRNTKSRRSNSTKNKEGEHTAAQENESDKQRCPQCKSEPDQSSSEPTETSNIQDDSSLDTKAESWVRCDKCKVWFHWRCAGNGSDLDAIDKWCERWLQYSDQQIPTLTQPLLGFVVNARAPTPNWQLLSNHPHASLLERRWPATMQVYTTEFP